MESGNQTPQAARYALIGAVAILIASIGYAAVGRKEEPKPAPSPVASEAPVTVDTLAEAARAAPTDPRAWAALGEAHFARNEYPQAVAALEKAAALDVKGSGYWSALGEARIYASPKEPMPQAALDAFRKAVAVDAKDPRARYFLAVKRDLDGDHKGAIDDWLALLAETPPGAPWDKDVRRTIQQSGQKYGIEVETRIAKIRPAAPEAAPGMPGPNAEQLKAAAALTPTQQEEMGRTMVARLEAKLQADPKNPDGWVMLMRSRMTLGEPDKASAALKAAVAANPEVKTELEGAARGMGVAF
jgi:cytochrome c-type biogenesis protein CcmH